MMYLIVVDLVDLVDLWSSIYIELSELIYYDAVSLVEFNNGFKLVKYGNWVLLVRSVTLR